MDGISYFPIVCATSLRNAPSSNRRPEVSDVINVHNLCFSEVTLNENETALLFSCLLIAASLFIMF